MSFNRFLASLNCALRRKRRIRTITDRCTDRCTFLATGTSRYKVHQKSKKACNMQRLNQTQVENYMQSVTKKISQPAATAAATACLIEETKRAPQ